jgi:hypothetical protein
LGPAGVAALTQTHPVLLADLRQPAASAVSLVASLPPNGQLAVAAREAADPVRAARADRLRAALDAVAQQHNAHTSLLYWYTDLEAAKAEARRSGKPILSLRLLGKLTDEYSCANSRFFRAVLYSNREVADNLRDTFVLHWSTERPVPIVTVDYGDGRVLKRTMMGNSAHYVLDMNGRPVDVIPGLYGPKKFLQVTAKAAIVAGHVALMSDTDATKRLQEFHQQRLAANLAAWKDDLAKVGGGTSNLPPRVPGDGQLEWRTLPADPIGLSGRTTDADWTRIAALRPDDAKLDEASKALVRMEKPAGPPAEEAMGLAVRKSVIETPMLAATRAALQLERDVALDTVRNEYRLHSRIHQWFAAGDRTGDFARLNQRVYAELFLTPASDPWMGLVAPGYTGLEGAGLAVSR